MRVTRKMARQTYFFPSVLNLEQFSEIIPDDRIQEEPIAEAFNNVVFQYITPGLERAVVILKAQGLSYSEISWILGVDRVKIHRAIYKIRDRLNRADVKKYLANPLIQKTGVGNNLTSNV